MSSHRNGNSVAVLPDTITNGPWRPKKKLFEVTLGADVRVVHAEDRKHAANIVARKHYGNGCLTKEQGEKTFVAYKPLAVSMPRSNAPRTLAVLTVVEIVNA